MAHNPEPFEPPTAARLAYEALEKDALICELALEQGLCDAERLKEFLDLRRMSRRPDSEERHTGSAE